jgi:hypothetical protein
VVSARVQALRDHPPQFQNAVVIVIVWGVLILLYLLSGCGGRSQPGQPATPTFAASGAAPGMAVTAPAPVTSAERFEVETLASGLDLVAQLAQRLLDLIDQAVGLITCVDQLMAAVFGGMLLRLTNHAIDIVFTQVGRGGDLLFVLPLGIRLSVVSLVISMVGIAVLAGLWRQALHRQTHDPATAAQVSRSRGTG